MRDNVGECGVRAVRNAIALCFSALVALQIPAIAGSVNAAIVPSAFAQSAELLSVELAIRDGKVEGASVIKAREGDRVELRWTTDAPVKLRLKGYDIDLSVTPERRETMVFDADSTGRFPVVRRGDKSDIALLYVEVQPR